MGAQTRAPIPYRAAEVMTSVNEQRPPLTR